MKYTNLLLIQLFFTQFIFGQDSLILSNYNTEIVVNNDSIFNNEPLKGKVPGINPEIISGGIPKRIKSIIINDYVLSNFEKDSIFNSLHINKNLELKFRQFLENDSLYQTNENILEIISVLNSVTIDYKVKSKLLIKKLQLDKGNEKKNLDFQQKPFRCGSGIYDKTETSIITSRIYSKELAVSDFLRTLKTLNGRQYLLTQLVFLIKQNKKEKIKSLYMINSRNEFDKLIKKIKKLKIKRVDILPEQANTAIYGESGQNGVLMIYY